MNKKERNSGIELLRIFCAMSVFFVHYHDKSSLVAQIPLLNEYTLVILKSLAISAVDTFLLISGYFLITTEKRTVGKIANLVLQVSIFNIILRILSNSLSGNVTSFRDIVASSIPVNYFVILYVTLYIISPYINILLKKLTPYSRRVLLVIMLLLFSIYPTFLDLTQELIGKEWWGLSTIGAWGNQQGFNIVNFSLLYVIGSILYLDGGFNYLNKVSTLVLSLLIIYSIIVIWALFNMQTVTFGMRSAWCYHNPLIIAQSVILFNLFKKIKITSKVINSLSGAVLTSYLLNSFILNHISIEYYINSNVIVMILHFMISFIILYVVSYIAFSIYKLFTSSLEKKLNKYKIPYITNVDENF